MGAALRIRDAVAADAGLVYRFVRDLANYERLLHAVTASEADLKEALFGPTPRVFALILEVAGGPVGFALWVSTFSTLVGRPGLWIGDGFVRPQHRPRGPCAALFRHPSGRAGGDGLGRGESGPLGGD